MTNTTHTVLAAFSTLCSILTLAVAIGIRSDADRMEAWMLRKLETVRAQQTDIGTQIGQALEHTAKRVESARNLQIDIGAQLGATPKTYWFRD